MVTIRMACVKVKESMDNLQVAKCCGTAEESEIHPDHTKELHRINRISGQVEGVKRMISNREYCPKIITQIQAIRAALKALEAAVLEKHLQTCVKEAWTSNNEKDAKQKMNELMELFKRQ